MTEWPLADGPLPDEGAGSLRDLALWCGRQTEKHGADPRVGQCLDVVARKVADPNGVTKDEMSAAGCLASDVARKAYESYKSVSYDKPWVAKAKEQHQAAWCAAAAAGPAWLTVWSFKTAASLIGREPIEKHVAQMRIKCPNP